MNNDINNPDNQGNPQPKPEQPEIEIEQPKPQQPAPIPAPNPVQSMPPPPPPMPMPVAPMPPIPMGQYPVVPPPMAIPVMNRPGTMPMPTFAPGFPGFIPQRPPFALAFDSAMEGLGQPRLLLVVAYVFSVFYAELIIRGGLFLWNSLGFGLAVITAAFYVLFTGVIIGGKKTDGKKVKASGFLPLIPLSLLLLTFCINSSPSGRNIAFIAALFLFMWQTTLMSGATNNPAFSFRALGDVFNTHFPYPFANMGAALKAVFGDIKKPGGKTGVSGRVFIGIIISIPVVIILIILFSAADAVFAELVGQILDKIFENLGAWIVSVIFGGIFFLYLLPLVLTLRTGYAPPAKSTQSSLPSCCSHLQSYISFSVPFKFATSFKWQTPKANTGCRAI